MEIKKLLDGRGWEAAYQAQGLDAETDAFLWQEHPVPFLDDPQLVAKLRGANVVRIIDAGAGDGRNSLALERQGFFTLGVDISPSAVKVAALRALRRNQNRAMFIVDDIVHLDHVVGPADAVFCVDTLGQLDDPASAIAAFGRILRPDGFLVFNVYSKEDETYGTGRRLDEWRFEYKDTLFRYYDEPAVRTLVKDWINVEIKTSSWMDPPHGQFRPHPHMHHSFVVVAQKSGGDQ